ncbi:MAG: alpha/beta hydrolase [Spongiibacteraceae bacterium]
MIKSHHARRLLGKAQRSGFNTLFTQAAYWGDKSPRIREARARCDIQYDVPYGEVDGSALNLDIYRPKNVSGKLPILMYVHGGAFTICSKETHRAIALIYARYGYLVFNIDYRLAPEHLFPAAIEDASVAYQWVVNHAADYGGDIDKFCLAGESAGDNLVLGLTAASAHKFEEPYAQAVWQTGVQPVAVKCLMGFLHVSEPQRHVDNPYADVIQRSIARDSARAYLGRDYQQRHPDRAFADPLCLFEEIGRTDRPLPPMFTGVGTADLCCNDTERLERAYAEAGGSIQARYYEDEMHAFHLMPWKKNSIAFWRDGLAFLDKTLKS